MMLIFSSIKNDLEEPRIWAHVEEPHIWHEFSWITYSLFCLVINKLIFKTLNLSKNTEVRFFLKQTNKQN